MLLLSQQRGEARCGVEARQAQPVHGAVAADQGGRLQVTDQRVILDPHENSSPGMLTALPWGRRAPDYIVPPEWLLPPHACTASQVMPFGLGPGWKCRGWRRRRGCIGPLTIRGGSGGS